MNLIFISYEIYFYRLIIQSIEISKYKSSAFKLQIRNLQIQILISLTVYMLFMNRKIKYKIYVLNKKITNPI